MERLRTYIPNTSPEITDAELAELDSILDIDQIRDDYEYAGSFIITKDYGQREEAVQTMCCGIYTKDIMLSNGQEVYFAFDYGH